jgi:hypothetical protein
MVAGLSAPFFAADGSLIRIFWGMLVTALMRLELWPITEEIVIVF